MKLGPVVTAAVLSAVLVPCVGSSAKPAKTHAVSDQIADLENRYSQTFVSGDVRAADKLLANAYMGFGSNGKTTDKATMLADVRSEPHQTSARITSLTIRLYGDTAIALGTEEDQDPGSKDIAHRVWLDTWNHTSAGWEMVASAEITPGR